MALEGIFAYNWQVKICGNVAAVLCQFTEDHFSKEVYLFTFTKRIGRDKHYYGSESSSRSVVNTGITFSLSNFFKALALPMPRRQKIMSTSKKSGIVQLFYSLTLNKLQHKLFQCF